MLSRLKRTVIATAAGAVGALALGTVQAITPFQTDVATAINSALAWLDSNGDFAAPSCTTACFNNAYYAVGLTTLSLLEKRASGNPNDPPQGYAGASTADQTRLRASVAAILADPYVYYLFNGYPTYFYAYFDGSSLSALSEYLLTGGPDTCGPSPNVNGPCSGTSTPTELQGFQMSVLQAINAMVDATLAEQRTPANGYTTAKGYPAIETGYWCYNDGTCTDSSTTQYASLGLSAVEAVYNNPTYGDPGGRLPKIQAALATAANVYATDYAQGSTDAACDGGWTAPNGPINDGTPGDLNAYGHGYHSPAEGYPPSLQQTSSGLFVQLLGGSNVNSPLVQGYMRWVYDHYRYTDIGGVNGAGDLYNSWSESYFYYLWSSFKGIEFMVEQGISPSAGNLGPTSYGTLTGTAAPKCTDRQVHRDPTTLPQVPLFGSGAAGYYSAETQSQYFDYAYTLLSYQCANGSFLCSAAASTGGYTNPGGWNYYGGAADTTSYALLVLQRATGVILPTATLSASAASAPAGTSVSLTWGSQNANSCAASGGTTGDGWTGSNLATSGSLPVKESSAGTYTYTITCSAGTQSAQAQVQVTFTAALMCDVSGPAGVPDGEVSLYDISLIVSWLNKATQPNGPASPNADPMGAGKITAQDIRACELRCTNTNCAN